ncbi:MAG: site-specific tyrosine recombinase XerC [candidate division BRC1 bacterium ADurb.BinA292]|nr:MAG: site-specific tyrosine recombinase XerC [candidate division BRC1 bacterium ADurb.BinA292]
MERAKLTKALVERLQPDPAGRFEVWDTDLPGFLVRIYPNGRKVFFAFYRTEAGDRRQPKLGVYHPETFKVETARTRASEVLSRASLGEDPSRARQEARKAMTFGRYAVDYMADAKLHQGARTWQENMSRLELHLLPALGAMRMNAISRERVKRLHKAIAEKREVERKGKRRGAGGERNGRAYKRVIGGPAHANKCLVLLKTMFNAARADGVLPRGADNPCVGIKLFKEKPRERYLTADELARLADAIAETEAAGEASPWAIAAIRLLIFTGARRNEILTLKWAHVDAETGRLRLPESKTGAKVIHLNRAAADILTALAQIRTEGNPYVIEGHKHGERLINLTKPWYRIRERASLPDLRLHDLRHVYAGVGAALGLGLPVVGKLLGHATGRTTERYANLAPDPVQAAAEAIGNHLAEAMARGKAKVVELAAENEDTRGGEARHETM